MKIFFGDYMQKKQIVSCIKLFKVFFNKYLKNNALGEVDVEESRQKCSRHLNVVKAQQQKSVHNERETDSVRKKRGRKREKAESEGFKKR